jgi:pseudouridine synthase
MEERLQKVLAAAGVASRREAETLITSGRVAVDGRVITELGTKADPKKSVITVDGKRIDSHPKNVYILLHKPRGYASTMRDPHATRVVTQLIHDVTLRLYPVGRLDVDTEGLLILTNDGDFTFKMTHPSHHVPKTYRAEVSGAVANETVRRLADGIILEDGPAAASKVRLIALDTMRRTSIVEIVLTEGRKRQVRRMLDAVGHPVLRLSRIKLGDLTLGSLKPGEWRFLRPDEVQALLALAS